MSISSLYRSTQPIGIPAQEAKPSSPAIKDEFAKLLQTETERPATTATEERLQLSQHAETRIRSRGIPWTEHLERRIAGGIKVAESKGSREALILADEVAVIANVKSRTIVTAIERDQLKDKVFTNIDSAVLV